MTHSQHNHFKDIELFPMNFSIFIAEKSLSIAWASFRNIDITCNYMVVAQGSVL